MDKVYYRDTYLRTLQCTVTEVTRTDRETLVRTDRTVFYPESGGQPGDRGTLGAFRVLDTRKATDGDSLLVLEPTAAVSEGDVLDLSLDWEHRIKFMRIHTAQHLLSGLLFTMFSIGTVAVHQGDEYLTIETDKASVEQDVIDRLVAAANEMIREDHRIIYHEMSHADAEALGLRRSIKVEGDVRIVEIEGVDRVACGGVHVSRTGEIGLVYCLGCEQIRGHVRLYFKCAAQALEALLSEHRIIRDMAGRLTCSPAELEAKVANMAGELSEAKARAAAALEKLCLQEILGGRDGGGFCFIRCEEGADIQSYCRAVPSCGDLALVVMQTGTGRTKWLIGLGGKYSGVDFNGLIRPLLAKINAKGGGRSPVFQGVADCADEEALASFEKDFRKTVSESVKQGSRK